MSTRSFAFASLAFAIRVPLPPDGRRRRKSPLFQVVMPEGRFSDGVRSATVNAFSGVPAARSHRSVAPPAQSARANAKLARRQTSISSADDELDSEQSTPDGASIG